MNKIFLPAIIIFSTLLSCEKHEIEPTKQKYDIMTYTYVSVSPSLPGFPNTSFHLEEVFVSEEEAKEICNLYGSSSTSSSNGYTYYIERGATFQLCSGPNGHPQSSMY